MDDTREAVGGKIRTTVNFKIFFELTEHCQLQQVNVDVSVD